MREHLGKLVIVALLAVVVGGPFVLRRVTRQPVAEPSATAPRLIVITPHNEQIRFEFARAFNAWRVGQGLEPIVFDWRAMGGTSDLRRIVLSQFEAAAADRREDAGIGVDLFFGGGDYEHNQLARGVKLVRDGREVRLSATVPPELPAGLLEQAFPEPTIGGERLVHPQRHWIGVALSSFGIVYNRDALAMLRLPEPTTWADLRDPRYAGWVALADPGHSGSIAATYHAVLRRAGWTEGWRLLREVFANSRYFTSSASKVPVDVSAGEAAAGMCIDFYGRFQAGAIGGDRVGYVDPPGMTATTADPISLLRGAPHRELAERFIAWLLSAEAQALWQRRLGTPNGPARFELRRLPARRDLYTPAMTAQWTDPQVDPFRDARPVPEAVPDYYLMVGPVAHAMAIDVHEDLVAAWSAIRSMDQRDPRRAAMLEAFHRLPPELTLTWPEGLQTSWRTALEDPRHPRYGETAATLQAFGKHLASRYYGSANAQRLLDDRVRWTHFFRRQYAHVLALAREPE